MPTMNASTLLQDVADALNVYNDTQAAYATAKAHLDQTITEAEALKDRTIAAARTQFDATNTALTQAAQALEQKRSQLNELLGTVTNPRAR